MADLTMNAIQKILEHLDKSMDDEDVDISPIEHEALLGYRTLPGTE